jgi:hypothetical protein
MIAKTALCAKYIVAFASVDSKGDGGGLGDRQEAKGIRVHPRGDGKYAQRAENGRDIDVTWRIRREESPVTKTHMGLRE